MDKFQETGIKAVAAHPGVAATDLQINTSKDGGMSAFLAKLMLKGAQSQEDGTIPILKGLLEPGAQSGDFFGPGAGQMAFKGPVIKFPLSEEYKETEVKKLLWDKSTEAVSDYFID